MKKFLIRIIILTLLVFVADRLAGYVLQTIIGKIETGGMGRDNYICNKATENILVFGSSRAVHHYNAKMLEDSLGLTCYNCGEDGNGIILNYGRMLMCKERKLPKVILYDIANGFDLLQNDNNQYLGWLKPRYDRNGIAEIFKTIDPKETIKMNSCMYRFNSRFLQNLVVFITGISTDTGIQGFRPLAGELDRMKIKESTEEVKQYQFDTLKLNYINKFVETVSHESELIFVYSPIWYGADPKSIQPITDICRAKNIKLLDFSNDPKYVRCDKYFKDGSHLNATGADEFTRDLIKRLKDENLI